MSDGGPSSIKRLTQCAVRLPASSSRYEDRVEAIHEILVYGLVLQHCVSTNKDFLEKGYVMHQALYRKWRPATFDEVCGQEHITNILKYEVANNKFSHAYLFCGSRGTGKTSCAKILSRAVNCLDPRNGNPCGRCSACLSIENGSATDVLEMDAASNNGVDNIRDIRDEVVYTPSSLKYRVYIIDEVHMLSTSAFNALLKTLEEPPEHVIFILATTELHKLPATIISRCQRFDFRRITTKVLKDRLLHIASNEGIEIEDSAAQLIARQAQGGMRDAISLLELCAGSRVKIDDALVHDSIGSTGRGELIHLCEAVISKDFDGIFEIISSAVNSSRDILVFWQELLSLYRDLLIVKISSRPSEYLDLTDNEASALKSLASKMSQETLSYHCSLIEDAYLTMQRSNTVKRIVAELTLVRMCEPRLSGSTQATLDRIAELEQRVKNISSGNVAVTREEKIELKPEIKAEAPKPRKAPKFDDDEDYRNDAPPAQRTAYVKTPATNTKKRVLKSFKNRAEVLEIMNGIDPMNASFVAESKWYTDDEDKVILKFNSPFTIDSIKIFNADTQLFDALTRAMGKQYNKNNVLLECDATGGPRDVIDEILTNSEE